LALAAFPSPAAGARCPADGSGSPVPWAPPWVGSSLAMATSSAIRPRHPSRPSAVVRRGQLTRRTSVRSSGGGEGEQRLCTPGREVGGLQIFLPFLLGRDVLMTEDGLGLSPNGIAAAKTLEPCVGVGHVEADLEENTPQPPTWRAKCRWISCRKNMGYHATDPKIRTQGAEHGDLGSQRNTVTEASSRRTHNALQRERHRALPRFRALVVR
jgi:hypothetical protein